MEKSNRPQMVYGYAVCLVAVITFIISIASLVNAVIDKQSPLQAERSFNKEPSLASFENYKLDVLKTGEKENTVSLDDKTLHSMYEAARTERIQGVVHRSNRSILTNSLLMILCIALFTTHWIWMRRIAS